MLGVGLANQIFGAMSCRAGTCSDAAFSVVHGVLIGGTMLVPKLIYLLITFRNIHSLGSLGGSREVSSE